MECLNCNLPCVAARSIKILTSQQPLALYDLGLSYIVCAISDGRTVTMSLDHNKAA